MRVEILEEVTKREKQAGLRSDPDVDTYMKVSTFNCSTFQLSDLDAFLFQFYL